MGDKHRTAGATFEQAVFSLRCTSRRAINRSMAMRERTGVSESGTVSRLVHAGITGASWPRSRHHPSQESTDARRAFQVLTAAVPHSSSKAAPISSSATAAAYVDRRHNP
ncbi:hypothetical protein [Nonomuraea sp. NPDC048916]|uniref:hypothetical protein n=1 Tax=Nonomuraea sp. NPDC048916 TaxID=3154232 RepID=UPI0033D210B1